MSNDTAGALIEVQVDALAIGGSMVGTIVKGPETEQGKKAFVRFCVPGERISARITHSARGHVEAELCAVLQPAADRIQAPCPYYQACGGCQIQHVPIEHERKLKLDMIRSLLAVRGLHPERGVTQPAPQLPEYGYRNRVTLHLAPPNQIGFYRQGTGDVVPVTHCLIASAVINEALTGLYAAARVLCSRVPSLVLEESDAGVVAVAKMKEGCSGTDIELVEAALQERFTSYEIRKSRKVVRKRNPAQIEVGKVHGQFSQVNTQGNEVLQQLVRDMVTRGPVDDLYAGSGNFTFELAARGLAVRAVEFDANLVTAGRQQAAASGFTDVVEFIQSSCERFVKQFPLRPTVLLDPPRAGAKEVVKRIDGATTREVVYVSCNIATFARDAVVLQEKGFRLLETSLVDMFPQTHHVETVSYFAK